MTARPKHCRPTNLAARKADRELADAVVAAACDVTGCPHKDASCGPASVPEILLVRSAAAIALMDAGWSTEWAAECCWVTRKNLERSGQVIDRIRKYAPSVLAAAREIAERGAAQRPDPRPIAEDLARDYAQRHGLERWARYILDPGGYLRRQSQSPRSVAMRRARVAVAAELHAHGYSGREIAAGMGFAPQTVATWLAESRSHG